MAIIHGLEEALAEVARLQKLNESLVERAASNSEVLTRMAEERKLVWTEQPPTEPGWYWWKWRSESAVSMHLVEYRGNTGILAVFMHAHAKLIWGAPAEIGGLWAGPIPIPTATEDTTNGS